MGAETKLIKNASGDRTSIYIGGQQVNNNAYLYSHDEYPFHYNLTTYGYFPAGYLAGVTDKNATVLDGNWPTWVAGEYEGITGQKPFEIVRL